MQGLHRLKKHAIVQFTSNSYLGKIFEKYMLNQFHQLQRVHCNQKLRDFRVVNPWSFQCLAACSPPEFCPAPTRGHQQDLPPPLPTQTHRHTSNLLLKLFSPKDIWMRHCLYWNSIMKTPLDMSLEMFCLFLFQLLSLVMFIIFILVLVLIRIIMRHTFYSCGCIEPRKRFKVFMSITNAVYLSRLLSSNTEVR